MNSSIPYRTIHASLLVAVPIVFAAITYFMVNTFSTVSMAVTQLLTADSTACGCDEVLAFSNHPWLYSSLLVLTALSSAVVFAFVVHWLLIVFRTRRFVRSLPVNRISTMVSCGRTFELRSVTAKQKLLCTVGILRPRIIISTGMQNALSESALAAALRHEMGHIIYHHVFKRTVLFAFLAAILWKWRTALQQAVEFAQELAADAYALEGAKRADLLAAFTESLEQMHAMNIDGHAVAAFNFTEERLRYLLHGRVHFLRFRHVFAAGSILFGLTAATGVLAQGLTLLDRTQPERGRTASMCLAAYEETTNDERMSRDKRASCPAWMQEAASETKILTDELQSTILNSR